ncbi:MAG TPA: hypothetical protein VD902_19785 [Symbiobacteriaceae bacterium]|nr:hypothetical protein [Symbiobacteriaceae bacterium]
MQVRSANWKRGKCLLAGAYLTAGTMVALLIAAAYSAPEIVFVTIASVGLIAVGATAMVADRFCR